MEMLGIVIGYPSFYIFEAGVCNTMEAVIQSTISALGCLDDGVYYPEPDCFESIRDLIRFLRYDNSVAFARRLYGKHNILQNDLVPLMKASSTAENLFDIALRLAINLTQPTPIAFGGKTPEDKDTWSAYLEEWFDRNEEAKMMAERIFVLVRNVLAVSRFSLDETRTAWGVNCHDKVVLALLKSGLGNYLISLAISEVDFRLLIMEIIAYVVKERASSKCAEPHDIAFADCSRTADEKAKDEQELEKSVALSLQKQMELRRNLSVRHSRFAGSYVVKGLKAVNQANDVVIQKALKDVTRLEFIDKRKVGKRKAKNRRPFDYGEKKHISTITVRTELKAFCVNVLGKVYNTLMKHCKDVAFGGRRTLVYNSADIHYFLIQWFFMEFRRLCELPIELVKGTVGVDSFHHVQIQLDSYLESARFERKEGRKYGIRAQYAVLAYKELLSTLNAMMESSDGEQKEEAQRICAHIMQVEEYRELSSSIIRGYAPGVFSKTFLRYLVLANHIYIRLLEKCVKAGRLCKVTRRKKVTKRRKKIKKEADNFLEVSTEKQRDIDLDGTWEDVSEELSEVLMGYIEVPDDVNPIDVMLDVDDTSHQRFAMLTTQRALRERRVLDAVANYRAARSVWLIEGCFGAEGISAEDEFLELHAIFFTDLSEVEKEWKDACLAAYGTEDKHEEKSVFDDGTGDSDDYSADNDEDEEPSYKEMEIEFNFDSYMQKFARKDVLKYVFLLAEYETNSVELNRAILKMLHRIAFDLNSCSRLFQNLQASLFRIFLRIGVHFQKMAPSDVRQSPHYEIYELGYHLLKKFFKTYERLQWKLIPEILFWKGAKECYEIDYGYGAYEGRKKIAGKEEILWPEELDDELRTLHGEYVSYEDKPEGIDVAEFIEHNLSKPRTRKQILREMKTLGLNSFGAKATTNARLRHSRPANLPPDLVEQMKLLVTEYNETAPSDLIDFVRNRMPKEFSRQMIIKQLRYEGIEYKAVTKKSADFSIPDFLSRTKPWPDELMTELRAIYQQYKALEHTSGNARKNQVEVSAAQDSDSFGEEQSENEEEKPLESIKTMSRIARSDSEEFVDDGDEQDFVSSTGDGDTNSDVMSFSAQHQFGNHDDEPRNSLADSPANQQYNREDIRESDSLSDVEEEIFVRKPKRIAPENYDDYDDGIVTTPNRKRKTVNRLRIPYTAGLVPITARERVVP
ncbi:unnamed protein product [Enterobius vermicularis]|uniref:TIMELESS domain-containing protein n=1 Tax=Enterobius vermicularis TaxID=51028 RepID=A0A158QA81_ENTVE|nr:unnamed protein product [Enterobius vermicularis]